jgi:hypothetical protein
MSMPFLPIWIRPDCLRADEAWALRRRTIEAMACLVLARLAIGLLPFGWWRRSLIPAKPDRSIADPALARRLAAHVDRGAGRLPFETKCLPRAMALSWMLQRRGLDHALTIATRPPGQRDELDRLHASVSVAGEVVLGDLPGPWVVLWEVAAHNV